MNVNKAPMNVCRTGILGLAGACVGMLLSVQSHALSLGGIQVESALDEPLRAEIPLQSVDAATLDSLEITLGSEQDFERAAVPRAEHLKQLEFTVSTEGDRPVVVVTTEQPVKEPFLHFLIAAEWSGGKLVREYTGLLDPPLYAGRSPATVTSPDVGEPAAAPSTTAESGAATPEPASSPGTSASTAAAGRSAEYGPTREGDTLWDIASKLDTGAVRANIFQVMVALLRQNPEAFIDNNVNRLKTGQTLQLQDIELVAEVSAEEASRIYTAQLEQWQSYKTRVAEAGGEPTTTDDAAVADAEGAGAEQAEGESQPADISEIAVESDTGAADQAGAEEGEDVLRIVQADVVEASDSEGASAGNDTSGELAELQGQIASLEETLESRTLENEELRERVRLLESQLQNAQRLVEIESQELAAAQQQAAEQQSGADSVGAGDEAGDEAEQATEEPAAADTSADEAQASAQSGQPSQSEARAEETQSGQQAAAAGAVGQESAGEAQSSDKVRQVANRPPQVPWWSQIPDLVFSSWIWMVGAGVGVLVLVLGLLIFMRRRQSIAEFEESILSGSALDSYSETTDSAAASASDTSFLSDFGTAGMGTMQADEVDPLAEAEVYLAYGRDEQAEDVLKEAARRDPERSEVKLKLMEIYKQRGDVKAFETLAEELYPAGDQADPEVWRQVTQMGRELNPDNPLFQDSAAAQGDPASGAQPDTVATGASPATGPAQATPQPEAPPRQGGARRAPPPASESDAIDFNLDDIGVDESAGPAAPGRAQAGARETEAPDLSDFQLDFDTESGTDRGGDLLQQPAGNVDPAEQPFPAPDEQSDLDRELERLASERESVTAEVAEAASGLSDKRDEQSGKPSVSWETADTGDEILDFPASDTSEIEFDLNLDDSSLQQGSGEGASQSAPSPPAASTDTAAGDGLLEFESDNIPPEETWAVPSSDATPGGDEDSVSYMPMDDVRSTGAPSYNEAETKLDLARAYMDMGDKIGARSIIDEVMREGDPSQRDRAAELASQL